MTPQFLALDWCGRTWTGFVPFGAGSVSRRVLPTGGGLYRIRVVGRDQLAYIGQTGRNLRARLACLMAGTLATEMPFNDPHTAAPKLWSFRDAEGLEYEGSAAPIDLPMNDRMGLECYLVWQYRRETGGSPLCNFGRLHPRYVTSRNRSTGVRGMRRSEAEPDDPCSPSVPALTPCGKPGSPDWMGLAWSDPAPLTASGLSGAHGGPGVYRLTDESGRLLYIGQSTALAGRLRSHARSAVPSRTLYSLVTLPAGYTTAQLLEVENDLIAGYFADTGHAPLRQFGQESESPAD